MLHSSKHHQTPFSRLHSTTEKLIIAIDCAGNQSGRRVRVNVKLRGDNDQRRADHLRNVVSAVPEFEVQVRRLDVLAGTVH